MTSWLSSRGAQRCSETVQNVLLRMPADATPLTEHTCWAYKQSRELDKNTLILNKLPETKEAVWTRNGDKNKMSRGLRFFYFAAVPSLWQRQRWVAGALWQVAPWRVLLTNFARRKATCLMSESSLRCPLATACVGVRTNPVSHVVTRHAAVGGKLSHWWLLFSHH